MSVTYSNTPTVFKHEKFGTLRGLLRNDEPWFVARDVCSCLGIRTNDAAHSLDEDEKGYDRIVSPGGLQDTLLISEPGLYSLILRSRKSEAKMFKRWVTHEVLPAIRKHGGYLTPATLEEALLNPDTLIRLAQELKEERTLRMEKEASLAVAEPKAAVYDSVVASKALRLSDFCRRFEGVNLNEVKKSLYHAGILYRKNNAYRLYARYRDTHFMEKFSEVYGTCVLRVLPEGQKLLTTLYKEGKLSMKVGYGKHARR